MRLLTMSLLCFSFLAYTGCGDTTGDTAHSEAGHDDHEDHDGEHGDEHEHAETYAEAMEELGELQATIDKAFTADTPDDAHEALHKVGHVLDLLPKLAKKEEFAAEKVEEIKTAADELFEAYGDLDGMMHGQGDADYADIGKKIAASMAKMEPSPTAEDASEGESETE